MDLCKTAAMQKGLKDLSFCKEIPIPGYYEKPKRKYRIRKAQNYKGKPHGTHLRVFKRKKPPERKCKCYICGIEGHYARECPRKYGNIARAAILEGLSLSDDWDVISVDQNEPDSEGICSVSENEVHDTNSALGALIDLPYEHEFSLMLTEEKNFEWLEEIPLPTHQNKCIHHWEQNRSILNPSTVKCAYCKNRTNQRMRIYCSQCELSACAFCAKFYLNYEVQIAPRKEEPSFTDKDELIKQLASYVNYLLIENEKLQRQLNSFYEQVEELEISKELQQSNVVNMLLSECERTVVDPTQPTPTSRPKLALKIKKIAPDAETPRKMTSGSVGYDLYAITDAIIPAYPENRKTIHTGIKIQFPEQMYGC